MGRKCCVPGCKTGYAVEVHDPGISLHRFPLAPDPRADKWLRAIPRKNWEPTSNSAVCSKHFSDTDFITESRDSNKYRKRPILTKRFLRSDAVPSFFLNVPKLSKERAVRRSSATICEARREEEGEHLFQEVVFFSEEEEEEVFSLADLKLKLDKSCFPRGFIEMSSDEEIAFLLIVKDATGRPFVHTSAVIDEELRLSMWCKETKIPASKVAHICDGSVSTWSQVLDVLAYVKEMSLPSTKPAMERCPEPPIVFSA